MPMAPPSTTRSRRLANDEPPAAPVAGAASGETPFNLSSAAATAVVFASIVLCFILLCTYCRCTRQRAIADVRRRVMRQLRESIPEILRPAAVSLPVVRYATTGAAAAAAGGKKPAPEDCAVCLEVFRDADDVKVVPGCSHVFHPPCIDRWLAMRNSCPVCRCAVVDSDQAAETAPGGGGGGGGEEEIALDRVVAMIEAIREGQREEEAVATAAVAAGAHWWPWRMTAT